MKAATIGLTAMVAIAAISFVPAHAEEGREINQVDPA